MIQRTDLFKKHKPLFKAQTPVKEHNLVVKPVSRLKKDLAYFTVKYKG